MNNITALFKNQKVVGGLLMAAGAYFIYSGYCHFR